MLYKSPHSLDFPPRCNYIIHQKYTEDTTGGTNGFASEVKPFLDPCGKNGFADFAFYRLNHLDIWTTLRENSVEEFD